MWNAVELNRGLKVLQNRKIYHKNFMINRLTNPNFYKIEYRYIGTLVAFVESLS